jgi:hypothetical protein
LEDNIKRVWVAAADLEARQHETDTATLDLRAAIAAALANGADPEIVRDASGVADIELTVGSTFPTGLTA